MSRYELGSAAEQTPVKWQHETLSQLGIRAAQRYPNTQTSGYHQIQQPQGMRLPTIPSYGNFQATNNTATGLYRPGGGFQQPQPQPGLITPSQQSQHHETQKLLAHLNTSSVSPQQLPQFVARQQPFMVAEDARLLEFRKLLPDWQTTNNSNKLADQVWQNANIANWMQQQQHHQQQQLLQQRMGCRKLSEPNNRLSPKPQMPQTQSSTRASGQSQQKFVPNRDMQNSKLQSSAFQQTGALLSPTHQTMAEQNQSLHQNNLLLQAMNEQIQSSNMHQNVAASQSSHTSKFGFLSPQQEPQTTNQLLHSDEDDPPSTVATTASNGTNHYSPSTTPPEEQTRSENVKVEQQNSNSTISNAHFVGDVTDDNNIREGSLEETETSITINGNLKSEADTNEGGMDCDAESTGEFRKETAILYNEIEGQTTCQPLLKSILDIGADDFGDEASAEGNLEENSLQDSSPMDADNDELSGHCGQTSPR